MTIDNPEVGRSLLADIRAEKAKRQAVSPAQIKARLLEEFSPKLHFLFEPHPYKIAWSGRYGQKSWSFAQAILQRGMERPLRVVCLRETMNSLEDSVHALMGDQIARLRIGAYYQTYRSEIRGSNGTEIFYAGLRGARADAIKSMEGCDIFWVEEGQSVSKQSWLTLDPTIRKPGAELWLSLNPRFAEDDAYKRWILNPPPGAVVAKLNYRDNQYLTAEMQEKIDFLCKTDPDMYEHVYEGATPSTVQDAVYKAQIVAAEQKNQFRKVDHDPRRMVETYWDLGYGDMVAIWFAQALPFETRIIDYYENSHQAIDHYLQVMQGKGYVYGECVLPWDGGAAHVSTGKSTAQVMKSKGFKTRVLRQGLVHEEIDALRTIFPLLYFDSNKCELGIAHLRRYQWGPPPATGTLKREPLHDEHSHAARALGALATAIKTPPANKPTAGNVPMQRSAGGSLAGFR